MTFILNNIHSLAPKYTEKRENAIWKHYLLLELILFSINLAISITWLVQLVTPDIQRRLIYYQTELLTSIIWGFMSKTCLENIQVIITERIIL